MEADSFFGTPKWKILEILADKPSSPSEISLKLKTSVSYISQQLKLLEAARFVIKEKTGTADKGKPRLIYNLSDEMFYLTILAKGWSAKKILHLTDYHKSILRIWILENQTLHYQIEKLYWSIEKNIKEIEGIFFSPKEKGEVIIVSDSKIVKAKIESFSKEIENNLNITFLSKENFLKKKFTELCVIHDPNSISHSKNEKMNEKMKGGEGNGQRSY